MKYLIIIIILFLFIIYYNLVLSRRNIELFEKNKKYKLLKKKLNKIKKDKNGKNCKNVSFVLDNTEQENIVDNMSDSIFSIGENNFENNGDEQSFALFSDKEY